MAIVFGVVSAGRLFARNAGSDGGRFTRLSVATTATAAAAAAACAAIFSVVFAVLQTLLGPVVVGGFALDRLFVFV
ncbi:hypothetical protein, partial [Phenylobacterium sp.]|uniref:hypothetical protein n=1 Tax=Phenylobacterium sp. TaxID=1871053 RepID=UPI002736E0AC